MKVAILSESGADEAAIRMFVEGLLGEKTEAPGNLTIRSQGYSLAVSRFFRRGA